MVGYRKEEYYLKKFGDEEGRKRYQAVVDNRLPRNTRRSLKTNLTEQDITDGNAIKCMECGKILKRITRTHLNKCVTPMTPADYKEKYPAAEIIAFNLRKFFSNTKESINEKYGEEIGSQKWNRYCKVQAETNTFEYKSKKYGINEDKFDEYNQSRAVTLENLIVRHGLEEGSRKWEEYCERQRYTTTVDYFIEKYGEVKGLEKWNKFYLGRIESKTNRVSLQETQVYNELLENGIELTQQFSIRQERTFIYDMANIDKKFLIEYNGDVWHMNPAMYHEDDLQPRTHRPAKIVWERDARKRAVAESEGYFLFTIWGKNWKKDKSSIIQEIKRLYEQQ